MGSSALQAGSEPYPGYSLRRLIGRGGFGEVWEATTADGGTLALKFLPCDNGSAASEEIHAIQALRRLQHPHLIRVDRVWCQPGYLVVAMERADGNLEDLLEAYLTEYGTPIVPEHLCLLLSQAADALDFLNTRQHLVDGQRVAFQHCDVKPSNFLLFGDILKVCDFGLASVTSSAMKLHRRAGTLEYAPPEIFQGRLSSHTDQYSLAVTYCKLRTGGLPFADTPNRFDKTYQRPLPDLNSLSPPERPIVARALEIVPQNRWPSCREFLAQLSNVMI